MKNKNNLFKIKEKPKSGGLLLPSKKEGIEAEKEKVALEMQKTLESVAPAPKEQEAIVAGEAGLPDFVVGGGGSGPMTMPSNEEQLRVVIGHELKRRISVLRSRARILEARVKDFSAVELNKCLSEIRKLMVLLGNLMSYSYEKLKEVFMWLFKKKRAL